MIAALLLALLQQSGVEDEAVRREELVARLESPESPAAALAGELQREIWSEQGEADRLLADLAAILAAADTPAARARCGEVLAELQFREGLIADAAESARRALVEEESDSRWFLRARLLDCLDRRDEALEAYARLRGRSSDPATQALVDRRVALIESARSPARGDGDEAQDAPSRLFELAMLPGTGEDARGRAAIVLAMLGRPQEAIRLYPGVGEGTPRFRREVRLAEWALAAEETALAQRHAWTAREHARTRRDRRYALAVLTEAYRADGSLDALIARFAAETELDEESRLAWIDLLRETARVDEALALFRTAGEDDFTPEMRRMLLDICREAGREDELVRAYERLIAAEPRRLEWREGYARYRLERGQQQEARAVWADLARDDSDPNLLLAVAGAAADLGMDELARESAESLLGRGEAGLQARLFLFGLELRRGRIEAAEAELEAFDREADARSPTRVDLADAYEHVGLKKRAVEVLEGIREVRGGAAAEEDLEMRLAWLLSETGQEERALELWQGLAARVQSPSRRRQVEDRLLATASRLGVIADIAVDLEQKLAAGAADEREASLLVRLYQKVGDPVSAAEILEEHLKRLGEDPLRTLDEKARVYLAGKDYYHFEEAVKQLIELEPQNRGDRLRQLAMSMLERGKPQQARAVLRELAELEDASDAAEFEAGVLALAKLDEEAVRVYRKGLAAHPERIDSYLLLAEAMRRVGAADRATGMFQFLVETAAKDDLFTVAVDGVLNMRARQPVLRWTLRAILERLAERDDRTYLFQLCSDLFEELEDNPGRMRALEASLPIANEQRAAVLRELMDLALGRSLNSYTIVNGRLVPQRTGGDEARRLAYGRRLISLGDVVPPDVYLELGEAFLANGEVSNAAKTFDLARDLPDWAAFQRHVAASFEAARFVAQALGVYERLMAGAGADAFLLLKTGELHEELGRDDRAFELYRAGVELLLDRMPLSAAVIEKREEEEPRSYWMPRNRSESEVLLPALESGLLAAGSDERIDEFLAAQVRRLTGELDQLAAADRAPEKDLAGCPRPQARARLARGVAIAARSLARAGEVDELLLAAFPEDGALLEQACAARAAAGYVADAERLARLSGRTGEELDRARAASGAAAPSATGRGPIPPEEAVARILPLLVEGDRDAAVRLLRSTDLRAPDRSHLAALQQLLQAALHLDDPFVASQLAQAVLRLHASKDSEYEDATAADQVLDRLRDRLDAAAFRVVLDGYVTQLLSDEEGNAFQNHLRVLTGLRRETGLEILGEDALRARVEESVPDRAYLLTSLLGLANPDRRLGLLKPVWSRIPPTRRSTIALGLFAESLGDLDEAYGEFLSQAFRDGLRDLENPRILSWQFERALRGGAETMPFLEPMVEAMVEKEPESPLARAQLAATRVRRGRMGAALEAMTEAVRALASPGTEEEYNLYSARRILVSAFVPENADRLLAAVDAAEQDRPGAEALADLRNEALHALGDRERRIRAAQEAQRSDPENPDKLEAYYQALLPTGEVPISMGLLQRLAKEGGNAAMWRSNLAYRYRALGDLVRARAAQAEPGAAEQEPEAGDGRLAAASGDAVREAAEAGRLDEARTLQRRNWREYGRAENQDPFFRVTRYYGAQYVSTWPAQRQPEDSPRDAAPPKSGLAAWNVERDPLRDAGRPAEPVRTYWEGLATYDFGRAEMRRQARSLDEASVAAYSGLIRGLACAAVEESGPAAASGAWLESLDAGRDGARERAEFLSFLERRGGELGPREREAFSALAARVSPRDGGALRAVARVYAALGDSERALRVYQWLASLATAARWIEDARGAVSAETLIEEVTTVLDGEARLRALEAILRRADPGGSIWERESFLRMSLETWVRVAGAEAAGAACGGLLAAIARLDDGILRRPAIIAARIHADRGRRDDALRALEIALCRFGSDEVRFSPEDWYVAEDQLEAPHVGLDDLLRVFPGGADSAPADPEWLQAAGAAALRWNAESRLHAATASGLLLLLAHRAQQASAPGLSRELLDAWWRLPEGSAGERLIAADLERLLGGEERARAVERELLAEFVLTPQRAPEVLQRIADESGPEAALAEAERLATWRRDRGLLETLVALHEQFGQADAAARWREEIAAQEAAAEAEDWDW